MVERETLRLFNAVVVEDKSSEVKEYSETLKRSIPHGYVLSPYIRPTNRLLNAIESLIGISGEKANATFHKSWKTIAEADIETLFIQQLLHYLTTYGFDNMGIFSHDTVYVPAEKLDVPEVDKLNVSLTVIKAWTEDELLAAIIKLGGSGIALHEQTLKDIMMIVGNYKFDSKFVVDIKNKELSARLRDYYNIVPTAPVAYLRYVISKLTDESLLIKNGGMIAKILAANGKFLDTLLADAPDDLASIFYRFKPLFLAMKKISNKKSFFNRLRKQAVKLHKPMPVDYLNEVTSMIKNKALDMTTLKAELKKVNVFRKIRLAYALKFRLTNCDSVIYSIRNGKGYTTSFDWDNNVGNTEAVLQIVCKSIAKDLSKIVKGKTIYIPEFMHYALPATEKQFVGNLPNNSFVSVPDNMIVGIHWYNVDDKFIDLDLSTIGISGKTGWDSGYRSDNKACLFSGDIVSPDPEEGATELFYLKSGKTETKLLNINYYNFREDVPVACKVLVAHEKTENFGRNYMVDTNNILAQANIIVDTRHVVAGVIDDNKMIFTNVTIGRGITARHDEKATQSREFLKAKLMNPIELKDLLILAGADVVTERPEEDYIDLSPEVLDKSTIIDLIQ